MLQALSIFFPRCTSTSDPARAVPGLVGTVPSVPTERGREWCLGEKRQDRENLPGDAKQAPGLLGPVVTRARQRTCYSINEAARTSTRLTPSSESELCVQARQELRGSGKRTRLISLSLHLLSWFAEPQAPVTRNVSDNLPASVQNFIPSPGLTLQFS